MTRPGRDREVFPHLEERVGEDPARFLDRELDTEALRFIESRIAGIDKFEVLSAWGDVERNLIRTPDGGHNEAGRTRILGLLEKRARELRTEGDREEQLRHRLNRNDDQADDQDDEELVLWRHEDEDCRSLDVERESRIAWFCHGCEKRTNRVEEVDPDDVSLDELPDALDKLSGADRAVADGGRADQ